jgi:hypothetical protein
LDAGAGFGGKLGLAEWYPGKSFKKKDGNAESEAGPKGEGEPSKGDDDLGDLA